MLEVLKNELQPKFQDHVDLKVQVFDSGKPGLLITIWHFKPFFGVLIKKYYSVG